jgi:alpha-tubulin suppressor-like RCC1 family protein
MARKAVQGYPEKSYYDNTRYLGIVATTDPLNEGLFKHMVNFDISDTGQSVQPREGFLTTRLIGSNFNYISLSNQTIIYKDNNINEYVLYDFKNNIGYIADVSRFNVIDKYIPITNVIANYNWRGVEEKPFGLLEFIINEIPYFANIFNSTSGSNDEKLNAVQQAVQARIVVLPDTKVEHIYDENSIHKTLIKINLISTASPKEFEDFKFIGEIYYRKDEVTIGNTIYPANTLTFNFVDTYNHPSLIPTERSLSVSKSIIPNVFQTLFTQSTRPTGQISNLGAFTYVYDDALNYVNNFIYRNTNYNIKPYFQLNPAFYDLNNDVSSTDKWAYKFEVVNTSVENFTAGSEDTIFSSPWMKYENNTTKPTRVFTSTEVLKVDTFVLGNEDITLNHYRNARYVIYVVPNEPNTSVTTNSSFISGEYKKDYPNYPTESTTYTNLQTAWTTIINNIKDIKTFKTSIPSFTNTLFYVVDLQATTPQNPFNTTFKTLEEFYRTIYTIDKDSDSNDGYEDLFITGADLLKLIENNTINFKNQSIAFRLLPFVANERHTETDRNDTSTVKYRWFFGSIINDATNTVNYFTSDTLFKDQQIHTSSSLTAAFTEGVDKTRSQFGNNIIQNNNLTFSSCSGVSSEHKVIIKNTNEVYVFGKNANGQLGLSDLTNRTTPTLNSSSVFSNRIFIGAATGNAHTYLITATSLISFGSNLDGRLGINNSSTANFNTPQVVNLAGLETGFSAVGVSSGSEHGVILSSSGKVWAWGANSLGQLGDGSTTDRQTPTPVSFSLSAGEKIAYITSGSYHNFALTNWGTLYGWGYNNAGRVGIGGTSNVLTPAIINFTGLKTNEVIVDVSAGFNHSVALTNFGRVFVWGDNAEKQLGEATTASTYGVPILLPLNFLEEDEEVVKVFTGAQQTYLRTSKNKIVGFGNYWLGHKADRSTTNTPVSINFPGLSNDEYIVSLYTAEATASTYTNNLAITNLNRIYVWGYDGTSGSLGKNTNSTDLDDQLPYPVELTGISLSENESIKKFESSVVIRIKENAVGLPNLTLTNGRYFDTRTWKLYERTTTTNNYVPFINTFKESFSLYVVKHNNFFVNNNYGFFKYNITNKTYSLETNLNILNNMGKTPINIHIDNTSTFNNQPPIFAATTGDLPSNAAVGTKVQVIGSAGTGSGTVYTRQSNGTWLAGSINGNTNPGVSFIKNQIYYGSNASSKRLYIWENESGTTGMLTEISLLGFPGSFSDLNSAGFFNKGLSINFYMRPYEEAELLNKTQTELDTLQIAWGVTSIVQTMPVKLYGFDSTTVTYITKTLTKEPEDIRVTNNVVVFESNILLTWNQNVLYISEPGKYYWFKANNKIEFNEEIIKAIQYKTIILVFTTQNLYAVYRLETTTTQLNTTTNQIEQNVTGVAWVKQTVLYNLLVSKKYADVIQVFNQMVLFYSEDGQLFMIRPSTTIDDQTRFSIQFFNKSANDILENYHVYINERLESYGINTRVEKNDVKIKALVSINYIKMFYYVPGYITYILIYDVLNNRYYVYDTVSFTSIYDKWFVESGELYVTESKNNIFITVPYKELNTRDNYVDLSVVNNFKKEAVNCLIDTGNLNLNNHLHKRFKDLHVTFKNLNSSNILFNLETDIDEIIVKPFYDMQLKVKDVDGVSYFIPVKKLNQNDLIELVDVNQISEVASSAARYSLINNLFENNNLLMDFSNYTSSKLLTHRTSILGLGKVFRLKLQFISKGLYKLQNFGIIYKERRI